MRSEFLVLCAFDTDDRYSRRGRFLQKNLSWVLVERDPKSLNLRSLTHFLISFPKQTLSRFRISKNSAIGSATTFSFQSSHPVIGTSIIATSMSNSDLPLQQLANTSSTPTSSIIKMVYGSIQIRLDQPALEKVFLLWRRGAKGRQKFHSW